MISLRFESRSGNERMSVSGYVINGILMVSSYTRGCMQFMLIKS